MAIISLVMSEIMTDPIVFTDIMEDISTSRNDNIDIPVFNKLDKALLHPCRDHRS